MWRRLHFSWKMKAETIEIITIDSAGRRYRSLGYQHQALAMTSCRVRRQNKATARVIACRGQQRAVGRDARVSTQVLDRILRRA